MNPAKILDGSGATKSLRNNMVELGIVFVQPPPSNRTDAPLSFPEARKLKSQFPLMKSVFT